MHDHILAIKELSRRLSLSTRTIRELIHDSDQPLPAFRVGGKLLFSWPEVVQWLEGHRVPPTILNTEEIVRSILNTLDS